MITSPLRPRDQQQEPGIAARGQLAQPRNALRRFTFVRHHDAPRASFRPALTEASRRPRYPRPSSGRPVNSGPRPCLRCWIPPIGLQVRTYTSDLNIRARHTPARLRLAGLRGWRQPHPKPGLHSWSSPTSWRSPFSPSRFIDTSMVSVSPDVDREGTARSRSRVVGTVLLGCWITSVRQLMAHRDIGARTARETPFGRAHKVRLHTGY